MTVLRTQKKGLLGLDAPYKALEVEIPPGFHRQISFLETLIGSSAWCRLLIFWSVITTLASVVSIYCAIDAQTRLNEATDNFKWNDDMGLAANIGFEPRYHDLAHRFAPFVERANADRRSKHRHHSHHKKPKKSKSRKSFAEDSKIAENSIQGKFSKLLNAQCGILYFLAFF